MRTRLVVLSAAGALPRGPAAGWLWLVDPSGTDPGSDTGRLLRALGVPERRVRVFPNQTAAHQIRRHDLRIVETPMTPMPVCWHATTLRLDRRRPAVGSLRHFLGTPETMRLLRAPAGGVAPSRFRPPVHVTIWS